MHLLVCPSFYNFLTPNYRIKNIILIYATPENMKKAVSQTTMVLSTLFASCDAVYFMNINNDIFSDKHQFKVQTFNNENNSSLRPMIYYMNLSSPLVIDEFHESLAPTTINTCKEFSSLTWENPHWLKASLTRTIFLDPGIHNCSPIQVDSLNISKCIS